MKIERQTIYMGDAPRNQENQKVEDRKSVDASMLTAKFDPIAARKAEAQKKALKVVGDVFAGDRKIDEDLEKRRTRIKDLQQENGAYRKSISELEGLREEIRKQCGVAEDSQEEQDLRLMAKGMDASRPGSGVSLTDEERKRLQEIQTGELTEYQQRSLEMKKFEEPYWNAIQENEDQIEMENRVIAETQLERLKTHPMVDAQKEAESILEEAGREIVGMLVDEGKEHVDEELEEKKEEAEKKAEEKEEQEEKLEKAKEEKKEQEELTEDILETTEKLIRQGTDMKAAKQEIQEIMNKMKLVEEDIKGAAVDKNV